MKITGLLQAGLTSIGLTWLDVLILLALLGLVVWLYIKGQKRALRAFVAEAEKEFGSGSGRVKLEAVLARFRGKLPKILQLFITEKRMIAWIDATVEWLKSTLEEDGADLLGADTEAIKALTSGDPGKIVGESSGPAE